MQSTDQAQLAAVLSRQSQSHHPTIRLGKGGTWIKITLTEARTLVKSGKYSWAGSKRRVRHMTLVQRWQPCYRTQHAPVIQPSIEWLQSRRAA